MNRNQTNFEQSAAMETTFSDHGNTNKFHTQQKDSIKCAQYARLSCTIMQTFIALFHPKEVLTCKWEHE